MFETIFLLIHKGIFIIQEGNEIQGNRKRKYINELKTPEANSTTPHTFFTGTKRYQLLTESLLIKLRMSNSMV